MSASLVGSEMCIRDRTCPDSLGVATIHLGVHPGCRSVACHDQSVASVSYTHLTLPTICSV
eukprot:14877110-Alexandrium_andersonii.AAC.1